MVFQARLAKTPESLDHGIQGHPECRQFLVVVRHGELPLAAAFGSWASGAGRGALVMGLNCVREVSWTGDRLDET
eukprot:s2856_g1.t1